MMISLSRGLDDNTFRLRADGGMGGWGDNYTKTVFLYSFPNPLPPYLPNRKVLGWMMNFSGGSFLPGKGDKFIFCSVFRRNLTIPKSRVSVSNFLLTNKLVYVLELTGFFPRAQSSTGTFKRLGLVSENLSPIG